MNRTRCSCGSTAPDEQHPYKYTLLSENGLLLAPVLSTCALIKPHFTF